MSTTQHKFMKSHQNAIERVRTLGFTEPSSPEPRTNPFTGKSHTLEPLACMLYDFITSRRITQHDHRNWSVNSVRFPRQTWDHARYAFQSAWPEEYMDLLD